MDASLQEAERPPTLHIQSSVSAKNRMNECPKFGSGQGALDDRNWVIVTVEQGGCFRPRADILLRPRGDKDETMRPHVFRSYHDFFYRGICRGV
ncbi:hypothetical protein ACQHGV_08245 [Sphingomonas pseudosanguinis]|uniref:hypothetical protein n=1 Tax=Sphingomonas pseudosanguinis TaxID=413712 RepID=UPI003F82B64D